MQDITIVGAGIGGLSAAIALQQKGFNCTLFDSAPSFQPVGAGIVLANNAMQVMQQLGLKEAIEANGNPIHAMGITTPALRPLSIINLKNFEKKYGVCNIAIHRAALQSVLIQKAGEENIQLNKRLIAIVPEQNNYWLEFEDGSRHFASILIGADGIHSVVRDSLLEKQVLRDSGQICWRGVCSYSLPDNYQQQALEAWGPGLRFGFVKLNQQQTYWYGVADNKQANISSNLSELFRNFNSLVSKIIEATPSHQICCTPLKDIAPFTPWFKQNICILGDAAHATTPNMGQGACQAIEDAYILGKLANPGQDITASFREYQQLRKRKAHHVVTASWRIGKVSHWKNKTAVAIRNCMMRSTPSRFNENVLQPIFKIQ